MNREKKKCWVSFESGDVGRWEVGTRAMEWSAHLGEFRIRGGGIASFGCHGDGLVDEIVNRGNRDVEGSWHCNVLHLGQPYLHQMKSAFFYYYPCLVSTMSTCTLSEE